MLFQTQQKINKTFGYSNSQKLIAVKYYTMQMNSCILGICIIIRAILVQKNLVLRLNIHGPICMRKKQLMLRVTKYRIICIVLIFKDTGFVNLKIFHSMYLPFDRSQYNFIFEQLIISSKASY